MPHVNGGGGDDLASSDEIKVFKEEGEVEEDKRSSSENLIEEKSSLVTESEEDKSIEIPGQSFSSKHVTAVRPEPTNPAGKPVEPISHEKPFNMGYTCIVTPYPYPNGTATPIQVSMVSPHFGSSRSISQSELLVRARDGVAMCSGPCCTFDHGAVCTPNKVGMVAPPHPGSPLPFMMYNGDHFAQPPPAHMGIPPVHIDPKTGMPRPSMYPLPAPGQYHHPAVFTPDFTQMQWHNPGMYAITTAAGFRNPYPTPLSVTTASIPRFNPAGLLGPHPGLGPPPIHHPSIITPGPKQDLSSVLLQESPLRHVGMMEQNSKSHTPNSTDSKGSESQNSSSSSSDNSKKLPHIKKPLNAFMLYMKEMRAKVVAECTLKESAAINQILGRRWHALGREEQAKYYELARKERQLHMQLYPGWSARDNYAQLIKKKKTKRCKSSDGESSNPKKCRARFGLDQQSSWCKPCRRKKKCIRYVEGADGGTTESEDNATSAGSVGEAPTPDSKSLIDSDHDPLNSSEISLSSPPVPSDLDKPIPCHSNRIISSSPLDANHPLSITQLTGQCNPPVSLKRDLVDSLSVSVAPPGCSDTNLSSAPSIVSVT